MVKLKSHPKYLCFFQTGEKQQAHHCLKLKERQDNMILTLHHMELTGGGGGGGVHLEVKR